MNGLIIEKKYYNEVTKEELENFIKNKYGVEGFNFCKDQDCVSGVNCLYDVDPTKKEYDFEAKRISDFILNGHYEDITPLLLANMAKRGFIPQGKYLIIT